MPLILQEKRGVMSAVYYCDPGHFWTAGRDDMQTAHGVPDESALWPSSEEIGSAEVQQELEAIVLSQPFRKSKQCQDLLRYIVDHSLRKDDLALRERILGIEVFGRASNYDTSEDPVVRMRAADVRKRLAQYYQSLDADVPAVYIELKPGSYRATFQSARSHPTPVAGLRSAEISALSVREGMQKPGEGAPSEAVVPRERTSRRVFWIRTVWALLAVGVLMGVGAAVFRSRAAWGSPQRRFWAPLTSSRKPILLYLGSNVAYRFTPEFQTRYQKEHRLTQNGPEFFIDLPRNGTVQTSDLMPVPGTFVTVGDLAASTQIVSLLNGWGKPFTLRAAEDLSIGDLRNTPAVLVGGFNNHWTLETTDDLRFSFREGTEIRDRDHPDQVWRLGRDAAGNTNEDYALISRVLQAKTGGPALTVSGIGSFGTDAAAEFVTSDEKMSAMLRDAPMHWEQKNFQAVLHIRVVANAPVGVEVVTSAWW